MLLRRPHKTYHLLPCRTARMRLFPPSTIVHSDFLRTVTEPTPRTKSLPLSSSIPPHRLSAPELPNSSAFKRDFKREKKSSHGRALENLLRDVIVQLATDTPLPAKFRDHQLTQKLKDFRECHLRPDLLLMYELSGVDALKLVRLGSHSKLFG